MVREAQKSSSPLTPQPLTEPPLRHVFELAMSTSCFCKKLLDESAQFDEIRKCDVSLRFLYMSRYLTQVSLSSLLTCFTRRTFVTVGVKKQGKVSCGSFRRSLRNLKQLNHFVFWDRHAQVSLENAALDRLKRTNPSGALCTTVTLPLRNLHRSSQYAQTRYSNILIL